MPRPRGCRRSVSACRGSRLSIVIAAAFLFAACSRSQPAAVSAAHDGAADVDSTAVNWRPNYITEAVSRADSLILRRAYGVEDPHRLYLSDSTGQGLLKYDTSVKRCRICYVNSYRVGYVSVRRAGESWEQVEHRVRTSPARTFAAGAHATSNSTADLDPAIRAEVEAMLRAAHSAGFHLRVTATYRSLRHEAYLMSEGRNRTHTLTSLHSYGRAIDIVIDDGNLAHAQTQRDWIAFRRWVTRYPTAKDESFRLLGQIDRSWDWPHVTVPSSTVGFRSVEAAVARGRRCLAPRARISCNFQPNLPHRLTR